MPRGFDYKRRRDWPAKGARREWPPLNPEDQDPTLLANIPTSVFDGGGGGGAVTLQETYASAFNSGVQTITSGTLTTIATTTFDPGNILSDDFVIGDWLDGTANTIRFPRDGIATVQATVDWDANTTGDRFLQYQSAGVSNVATTLSQPASNFVYDALQVVTNQDIYSAGDYGLIQVRQNSGANRTCFVEWVVFYHAIVS
jgi:hypothetical protein